MVEILNVITPAAIVPLIVMSVTLAVQYWYRRCDKKAEISNLAKILTVEIESFLESYESYRLPEIPPEDVRDLVLCKSLDAKNIYVFTNSVHRIGVFDLEDVRVVVSFYMKLKALIDSTEKLHMDIEILKMFATDESKAKKWFNNTAIRSLYEKTKFYDVAVFNAKSEVLSVLSRYLKPSLNRAL